MAVAKQMDLHQIIPNIDFYINHSIRSKKVFLSQWVVIMICDTIVNSVI